VSIQYLLLAFFFGFVFLLALDPFIAVDPFVVLDPFVAFVNFDPFVALALFVVAALTAFGALAVDVDVDEIIEPLVLTCCLACLAFIAKNSCLLEHPVFSKILLMIGEVSSSSSMVERAALESLETAVASDDVMEKAMELFVRTFFLVTYGLSVVLRRRRRGALPFREEGSFSLFLW